MAKFLPLILFLFSISALATPAQVIMIRHAEKPADKNAVDLAPKGFQRADALAHVFEVHPELTKFGLPVALFASAYVPGSNSKRTIETLTPLSVAIHVDIDSSVYKDDYQKLADMILANPAYNGKTVMIAWVSSSIAQFAKALGSSPADQWDDTKFDRLWVLNYDANGKATSVDLPQNLLPGDSN